MPFSTREAEATETSASRATVAMVGGLSGSGCCKEFLKTIRENVYSALTLPYDRRRSQGDDRPRRDPMAEITLDNVTKEFGGGVRAVDGIDLTIASGEFIV